MASPAWKLPVAHFNGLLHDLSTPEPDLTYLRLQLEKSTPVFSKLLKLPGQAKQEKETLSKGNLLRLPDSDGLRISEEFKQEASNLSKQLNLSEYLSACLYAQATLDHQGHHQTNQELTETAILLYYELRANILSCLVQILRLVLAVDIPASQQLRGLLDNYLTSLINKSGTQSWPERILAEIDRLAEEAKGLQQAAPVPQPGNQFSFQQSAPPPPVSNGDAALQAQRLSFVQAERRQLGTILFLVCSAGYISKPAMKASIQWMSTRSDLNDDAVFHVLVAVLAALDPTRKGLQHDETSLDFLPNFLQDIFQDAAFITSLNGLISKSTNWQLPILRMVILLQWTIFMAHACQRVPGLEDETQIFEENVERDVYTSVEKGCFDFLLHDLLAFKYQATDVTPHNRTSSAEVDSSFRSYTIRQVDALVVNFINTMHSILKKLKNKEEDARTLPHHSTRSGLRRSGGTEGEQTAPRQDVATFFELVASLYRDRPEEGLKFWSEDDDATYRLNAFVRWASDCKGPLARPFFNMLTSLSTGPEAATCTFDFLLNNGSHEAFGPGHHSQTMCSWNMLFGAINHYSALLHSVNGGPPAGEFPPEEARDLTAFARLLAQVVRYSEVARLALHDNARYRPIPTLFSLVTPAIPLHLKAALLDAIAVFARGGTTHATDIALKTWDLLESSQMLATEAYAKSGRLTGGVVVQLNSIEAPAEIYPSTTSFVNLLASLIHVSNSSDELEAAKLPSTVPENLGAPHRRPGLDPYISFAIDEVLLKMQDRKFRTEDDKWRLIDCCISFLTNALASLDLDSFLVGQQSGLAQLLIVHPGFDVLIRLLSGSGLLDVVLEVAGTKLDDLDAPKTSPYLKSSVHKCLKMLLLSFNIEPKFLELVLPLLWEQGVYYLPSDKYAMVRASEPLDTLLLTHHQVVPQIAALVNCSSSADIPLLAVQLISAISLSRQFSVSDPYGRSQFVRMNRLVGFIDQSPESLRILSGFVRQLESKPTEEQDREQSIQLQAAILDLLLRNTEAGRPVPNIAHYLLGFDHRATANSIKLVEAPSFRYCFQSVLNLVQLRVNGEDSGINEMVAEKSLQLLYQLYKNEYTSEATAKFLRSQEDFFVYTLSALPLPIIAHPDSFDGHYVLNDVRLETTVESLCASLHSQAWLLKGVALELNEVASDGKDQDRLSRLAYILLSAQEPRDASNGYGQTMDGQSSPKMLDILYSLAFSWQDAEAPVNLQVSLYTDMSYDQCLVTDKSGCELFSLPIVASLLRARERELRSKQALGNVAQQTASEKEKISIIEFIRSENRKRIISHARANLLEAWSDTFDIVMMQAFQSISVDQRQLLLLDLLDAVFHLLTAAEERDQLYDQVLSSAVTMMTFLREEISAERKSHETLSDVDAIAERLSQIFRSAFGTLFSPGLSANARGNLYLVVINCLRLTADTATARPSGQQAKRNTLDSVVLSVLQNDLGRFLPIVSRDAMLGEEAWQMVAYTLLDAVLRFSHSNGLTRRISDLLAKQGHLQTFVASIKGSERDILDALAPDPDTLNPLYVYDAKISFLTRFASTHEGAEKLMDVQLITRLAQSDFLSVPPTDERFDIEVDSFMPPVTSRHQQLMLSAIRLLLAVQIHTNQSKQLAFRQIFSFVLAQRDAFIHALQQVALAPTLTSMKVVEAILQLLKQCLAVVTEEDMISPSAFGGLHMAVLGLAAKVFQEQSWEQHVVPMSDKERSDQMTAVVDPAGQISVFDRDRRDCMDGLSLILLMYLQGATSTPGAKSFRPSVTGSYDESSAKSSRLPSLHQALVYCRKLVIVLGRRLEDHEQAKNLRSQDGDEMDYSRPARQEMTTVEELALARKTREGILVSLQSVQVALLLILRHIQYYFGEDGKSAPDTRNSRSDPQEAKSVVNATYRTINSRLQNLRLTRDALGTDARPHEVLLEQIVRRTSDLLDGSA